MKDKNIYIDSPKVFITAIISFIIMVLIIVFCSITFVLSANNIQKNNQVAIENAINNLKVNSNNKSYELVINNDAKKYIKKITDDEYKEFLIKYNENQTNWLNFWLTLLAVLLAFIGLVAPLCFMKLYDDKKKEMDKIIEEAKIQKDKTVENILNIENKINENNRKTEELEKILAKVKDNTDNAESFSKYTEAMQIIKSKTIKKEKLEYAHQLLKDAYQLNNTSSQIIEAMAMRVYYKEKKYTDGINLIKQLLEKDKNPEYYVYLSELYEKIEEYDESLNNLDLAIGLGSNKEQIQNYKTLKAIVYSKMNKNNDAISIAEELLSKSDISFQIKSQCGLIYINLEDYEKAIQIFEEQYKRAGHNADLYNLIEAYIFNGDLEKAEEKLNVYINNKQNYICSDDKEKWLEKLNKYEQNELADKIRKLINNLEEKDRDYDE